MIEARQAGPSTSILLVLPFPSSSRGLNSENRLCRGCLGGREISGGRIVFRGKCPVYHYSEQGLEEP